MFVAGQKSKFKIFLESRCAALLVSIICVTLIYRFAFYFLNRFIFVIFLLSKYFYFLLFSWEPLCCITWKYHLCNADKSSFLSGTFSLILHARCNQGSTKQITPAFNIIKNYIILQSESGGLCFNAQMNQKGLISQGKFTIHACPKIYFNEVQVLAFFSSNWRRLLF